MNIILHLGGSWKRSIAAAELAVSLDEDYIIVVSSDKGGDKFRRVYREAGIPDDKVIWDGIAWDTVTNFTHTYKLLKSLNAHKVYVVTHAFHMPRSMAIAKEVWRWRAEVIPTPYAPEVVRESDLDHLEIDRWRARIWRYLGVLFYWSSVAEKRDAQLNKGHALLEVGIS